MQCSFYENSSFLFPVHMHHSGWLGQSQICRRWFETTCTVEPALAVTSLIQPQCIYYGMQPGHLSIAYTSQLAKSHGVYTSTNQPAYSGHWRRETSFGCQVQLVGLLDHLLIALAGIPSTSRHPTLLYCSPQLRLQPLRPHFSYKLRPLCSVHAATSLLNQFCSHRYLAQWLDQFHWMRTHSCVYHSGGQGQMGYHRSLTIGIFNYTLLYMQLCKCIG